MNFLSMLKPVVKFANDNLMTFFPNTACSNTVNNVVEITGIVVDAVEGINASGGQKQDMATKIIQGLLESANVFGASVNVPDPVYTRRIIDEVVKTFNDCGQFITSVKD